LVNSPAKGLYGGMVAAPIFKEVAGRIINLDPKFFQSNQTIPKEVPEVKTNYSTSNSEQKISVSSVSDQQYKKIDNDYALKNNLMPDLSNCSIRDALLMLSKLGIKYKVSGSGFVKLQSITPGEKIQKGLVCKLSCEDSKLNGAVVY
jgi:cell division protein FtsI (penicillin-binding protein 3)